MPKRFKVEGYTGIYFRITDRIGGKGQERVYYVVYKKGGKAIEAKAGRQYTDGMTPAKAVIFRSNLIEGRELTPQENRDAKKQAKITKETCWTLNKLWTEYKAGRKIGKGLKIDIGRYDKYLKNEFGQKEPMDILPLDVERLKRRLLKTKSAQTVKHVLNLLTWIVNFGVKQGLCSGLSFHITKPTVSNEKTEDLTQAQLEKLLKTIENEPHKQAGNMMLLALYSGMRRGEMFKLQWHHIDFQRGFITLVNPKGGKEQRIPLNNPARALLESIPKRNGCPYVFPGRKGVQRVDINKDLVKIKQKAGLPTTFRALHGLRHVFASQLASSGQVDMYVLQRLLTHKDPRMTQRYAHLRDEALKQASQLAGKIVTDFVKKVDEKEEA